MRIGPWFPWPVAGMFAYAGCYGKLRLPRCRPFRLPAPMLRSCLLQLELYFNGCRSLKEKRRRLKGLRDRVGRAVNVAVCESGHQDSHQRSEWSVIAAAADAVVVERMLAEIERTVQFSVDAELVGVQREWLR